MNAVLTSPSRLVDREHPYFSLVKPGYAIRVLRVGYHLLS
jgi:hypothetical protein